MTDLATQADLDLVASFVNTKDLDTGDSRGEDALGDPAALGDWLASRELLGSNRPVTRGDFDRAIAAREAIRALAGRNNPAAAMGGEEDPAAILNAVARDVRLVLRFTPEGRGSLTSPDEGVDGALGRVLGAVFVAMADGSWERFKACARHSCRWVYYDRSRNRSRTWCSMRICGNRAKAKAFRERRRAEG